LHRELIQLKARINNKERAEKARAQAIQFSQIDEGIDRLAGERNQAIELAEALAAEVDALRVAVRTGTRPVRAGVDEGVRLFGADENGQLHPFQHLIKQLEENKKCTTGQAIQFAARMEPAMHRDWIAKTGGKVIHA
jgi:hypothetical protein